LAATYLRVLLFFSYSDERLHICLTLLLANPSTGSERIDLTDEESPRSSAIGWSCELAPMHKEPGAQLFAQAAAVRHITPMPISPTTPLPSGNRQWSPSEELRARKPG
jgi:hypothetical protein